MAYLSHMRAVVFSGWQREVPFVLLEHLPSRMRLRRPLNDDHLLQSVQEHDNVVLMRSRLRTHIMTPVTTLYV